MVRPGSPKVPDINRWEDYISFRTSISSIGPAALKEQRVYNPRPHDSGLDNERSV